MGLRQDITPFNEKGKKHGLWVRYHSNDTIVFKGHYVNGREHGWWEWYAEDGSIEYKGTWFKGEPINYCEWVLGNKIIFYLV